MAEYTIELRDVVENHNIFDFNYPFYDPRKRPDFEERFIKHFFFREICCPSIDRFKFYLEEKMLNVFPYYNKLFEAAQIEYSVLDNYKLTEEYESTKDNRGKTAGVSSTVGQRKTQQDGETDQDRVVDTVGNVDTVGKDTEQETTNTETTNHSTVNGTNSSQTNGTSHTETTENEASNEHTVEKFLDTPQGLTNLSDSKYLTTLKDIDTDRNTDRESMSDTTSGQTVTGETSEVTDGNGNSQTVRNLERNSTVQQDSDGKETTKDKVVTTLTDEQKTTEDNNTRVYMEGVETEKHKLVRSGNIGVDTDSDMIEKHIKLQQKLTTIEIQFFAQCEDLFMMVY